MVTKTGYIEINSMKILFVHQNFPGQFKFLAPALANRGHEVVATSLEQKETQDRVSNGITIVSYTVDRGTSGQIHPWMSDLETKVIRGEGCMRACAALKQKGFNPDLIMAHHGWGESLFLKEIWPSTKLALYCEYYYSAEGADSNFDPEFAQLDLAAKCRLNMKNVNNILNMDIADAAISPTIWQAGTFPEPFKKKIKIIHDGIDTTYLCANKNAQMSITPKDQSKSTLTPADEILTFVNRDLEPYRGYHTFMRALPRILEHRPNLKILIVGGNGIGYGAKPDLKKYKYDNWCEIFAQEVKTKMPSTSWERIHYLGNVPYDHFKTILQVSSLHVYLTYPFVLSWSLLEAMSIECPIIASSTTPVLEFIEHDKTGVLVDFFDSGSLAREAIDLLGDDARRKRLGTEARKYIQRNIDLNSITLPSQIDWIESLI